MVKFKLKKRVKGYTRKGHGVKGHHVKGHHVNGHKVQGYTKTITKTIKSKKK